MDRKEKLANEKMPAMPMKVRKTDLPRKNFSPENIMYSLSKAISAGKEGNWENCGFPSDQEFVNYLDALEKKGVIAKKKNPYSASSNLANFIYIGSPCLDFDKKNRFLGWLKENVVGLLNVLVTFCSLFAR